VVSERGGRNVVVDKQRADQSGTPRSEVGLAHPSCASRQRRYGPANQFHLLSMAETRSARPAPARPAETTPGDGDPGRTAEWLAQVAQQGLGPDQIRAAVALAWLGRQRDGGEPQSWIWTEEPQGSTDLACLRQRLEVIQLALQTGAPLSTAEVTRLLGARPGSDVVERGGLRARRVSRNVWKLSRSSEGRESSGGSVVPFSEGFRRRL